MLSTNLKEATKAAHQELEKKVVLKLKSIRSAADYADLLKHFYAYFDHLRNEIEPYITPEVLPDYAERRDASYIKRDIEALGFDTTDLPLTTVPKITNTQEALGALYVMEGSIMGGRIIVEMLAKVGVQTGVSFFSGYGAQTGEMWGRFVEVLNASAKNEAEEQLAVDAANAAFTHFSDVFTAVKVA
ncbi:biliverdin-producing heme oxygenase [Pedobacter sp. MW01-1-1]|uniref:biliverdin-producing heme oxygenase n=1 Tax=Pedobacter sp. MW01-1-1 TaxID=3383027 RepID=UPI003FF087D0